MFRSILQDAGQFFRKLSRILLYFVVALISASLSFVIVKSVVHALYWIQVNWIPRVWWIF